jgi:trk system potassium uptake protein TrkH
LGAIIVTTLQWKDWVNMPAWLRVLNGLFTSVTSRTAGFSTVSISMLSMPTLILVMLLMYIGASPNSTGGGIKVTTFGTLLAASWAFIRGKDRVEIAWNTIPMTTVRRSYIVLLGSLILITIAIFSISIVESAKFSDLLFEVISAFGNVGLSRGITPQLSGFSKIIITIVMFMGRVGLYTLSIAVGRESVVQYNYSFSETNIMVG